MVERVKVTRPRAVSYSRTFRHTSSLWFPRNNIIRPPHAKFHGTPAHRRTIANVAKTRHMLGINKKGQLVDKKGHLINSKGQRINKKGAVVKVANHIKPPRPPKPRKYKPVKVKTVPVVSTLPNVHRNLAGHL